MRRQLHHLVALCVFSVLGVSTSLMPVASASADQTTPSPATSSSPADVTPPPDARPAGQASATGAPASSAGASTSAQPSPSPSPPSAAGTPLAPFAETTPAAPLNPPITTITSTPPLKSTSPSASFAFTADRAGVTFQCKLSGPGQTDAFEPCDVQPAAGDTTTLAQGSTSYSGLKAGTYTFTVHATPAEPAGSAPGSARSTCWRSRTSRRPSGAALC